MAVDGVLRGNRHATEAERRQAVDRCGRATGVFDDRCIALIDQTHRCARAFPFGRGAYGIFTRSAGRGLMLRQGRRATITSPMSRSGYASAIPLATQPPWPKMCLRARGPVAAEWVRLPRRAGKRPGGA
ncbi:hypothetical protein DMH26_08845 [Streptomyces sp. WAC 05379]|nr:hypothetical protein DMH26_08845 [Streptomyces sp. WAC 05379]